MNTWNEEYKEHHSPIDSESLDSAPIVVGGGWCPSSSVPEFKCATVSEVESQANWNQSQPSTSSEGKAATTGALAMCMEMTICMEMTPALHGSARRPEAWEFRVRRPEFITQSRGTEEIGALPSNTAEMGTSQKVAKENMEGDKGKSVAVTPGIAKFRVVGGVIRNSTRNSKYWLE
ncbi:hypothetical protein B0H13DRAFT_1865113 [Mycena leptocephala]|nr:hypothetical protein B0H13DRAFT_1865113 [Mycena leptocephala]